MSNDTRYRLKKAYVGDLELLVARGGMSRSDLVRIFDIPSGIDVVDTRVDPARRATRYLLRHASFDEVLFTYPIPEAERREKEISLSWSIPVLSQLIVSPDIVIDRATGAMRITQGLRQAVASPDIDNAKEATDA